MSSSSTSLTARLHGLARTLAPFALPIGLLSSAIALVYAPLLEAQFTGGSVGGGGWGGGGGGGGGGSSSRDSDGDVFALLELIFFLFRVHPLLGVAGIVALLAFVVFRAQTENRGHNDAGSVGSSIPSPTNRRWMQADITEVRIALAGDARAFLQRELMEQGRRADTRTKAGLLSLLHIVVRALKQSETAWIYAGAKNFHPMSTVLAQASFTRLANDARAKFTHELIRKDASGQVREGQGHGVVRSREREGDGVIVVTLIVAAGREIVDFQATSRAEIHKVLDDLRAMTVQSLIALEISWLPADEGDLMSTATLETLHPDMKKLPGVVGGRMICTYCKGPYAAELPKCPHCGAPSPSASPSTHP